MKKNWCVFYASQCSHNKNSIHVLQSNIQKEHTSNELNTHFYCVKFDYISWMPTYVLWKVDVQLVVYSHITFLISWWSN